MYPLEAILTKFGVKSGMTGEFTQLDTHKTRKLTGIIMDDTESKASGTARLDNTRRVYRLGWCDCRRQQVDLCNEGCSRMMTRKAGTPPSGSLR